MKLSLNPKPCPLIEIVHPPFESKLANNCNILSDFPKYRIFKNGEFSHETLDVKDFVGNYDQNMIGFLIGCSYTFEGLLNKENLTPKHV